MMPNIMATDFKPKHTRSFTTVIAVYYQGKFQFALIIVYIYGFFVCFLHHRYMPLVQDFVMHPMRWYFIMSYNKPGLLVVKLMTYGL